MIKILACSTVLLASLKLGGVTSITWAGVLAPLWIPLCLFGVMLFALGLASIISR